MPFLIFFGILVVVILPCIKMVRQSEEYVVERLGGYLTTWTVGLHFKVPFIDRVASKVTTKEQVVDFPPQSVITKDNVQCRLIRLYIFR